MAHGLDCEAHSWFHCPDSAILGVVRNVGCTVEEVIDAMAGVLPDHSTPCGASHRFSTILASVNRRPNINSGIHGLADVTEESSGLAELDGLVYDTAGVVEECIGEEEFVIGVEEGGVELSTARRHFMRIGPMPVVQTSDEVIGRLVKN